MTSATLKAILIVAISIILLTIFFYFTLPQNQTKNIFPLWAAILIMLAFHTLTCYIWKKKNILLNLIGMLAVEFVLFLVLTLLSFIISAESGVTGMGASFQYNYACPYILLALTLYIDVVFLMQWRMTPESAGDMPIVIKPAVNDVVSAEAGGEGVNSEGMPVSIESKGYVGEAMPGVGSSMSESRTEVVVEEVKQQQIADIVSFSDMGGETLYSFPSKLVREKTALLCAFFDSAGLAISSAGFSNIDERDRHCAYVCELMRGMNKMFSKIPHGSAVVNRGLEHWVIAWMDGIGGTLILAQEFSVQKGFHLAEMMIRIIEKYRAKESL